MFILAHFLCHNTTNLDELCHKIVNSLFEKVKKRNNNYKKINL